MQNQQALSTRVHSDLAVVHENVSRNTAANREAKIHRSLDDSRKIIVRGVSSTVRHEPPQLVATLLTALKLQQHVPLILVVSYGAWNPIARAKYAEQLASAPPAAPVAQFWDFDL